MLLMRRYGSLSMAVRWKVDSNVAPPRSNRSTLKRDKRSADYRHDLIAGKGSIDNNLSAAFPIKFPTTMSIRPCIGSALRKGYTCNKRVDKLWIIGNIQARRWQESSTFNITPNHMSLTQARDNYRRFGACQQRLIPHVRPPLPEEL